MSCPSDSSGLKTADAVIADSPARLHGVKLLADGTNAATLTIYDNASAASGKVLAKISVKAGDVTETAHGNIPEGGVHALNGIYADVSGTGAEYIVYSTLS